MRKQNHSYLNSALFMETFAAQKPSLTMYLIVTTTLLIAALLLLRPAAIPEFVVALIFIIPFYFVFEHMGTTHDNAVQLRLPDKFNVKQIEVIILPSERNVEAYNEMEAPSKTWSAYHQTPPPLLPMWTEEERKKMLALLLNGPTMSEEEITEWEKDLEQVRSWKPREWSNE